MDREQLEEVLLDLCGETDKAMSWAGQRQAIARVLSHWDRLHRLADAASDVLKLGNSMDMYFDGRPEGNAPSHRHANPPRWDHSGELCGWCAAWMRLRKLVKEVRS